MKILNYDHRTLLLQNIKKDERQNPAAPEHFTRTQYDYLCKLIRRKKVSRPFFQFLISELYNEKDWRKLSYQQMYELIHVLTYYNYKGR